MIPGEILGPDDPIEINGSKRVDVITVRNLGDRPIQVGSHFHFAETNAALDFDREVAHGKHLDIAAGTAVRFEPGIEETVTLVPFGGRREVWGLRGLTGGPLDPPGADPVDHQ